jgi:ribosome-associated toxin RatA of RatAB toxin-antitoxin module
MFDLVAAVEAYPQFLPWCGGSQVHERTLHRMVATVGIDYRGIRQSFTTENELHSPHRIGMTLREGPFSRLDGLWHFHTLRHDACKVEFRLDYAFKSGLLGQALVPVFDHIARSFVDAFVRRAEVVFAPAAVAAETAAHLPEAATVQVSAVVPPAASGAAGRAGG